jgi:hypothetical protein
MMTWLEFAIVVFAAYRITRFVTLDSLLDNPRDAMILWAYTDDTMHTPMPVIIHSKPRRWLTWLRAKGVEMLTCRWCFGFWCSGAVYLIAIHQLGLWSSMPVAWHLIAWWAVAGAAAFVFALEP